MLAARDGRGVQENWLTAVAVSPSPDVTCSEHPLVHFLEGPETEDARTDFRFCMPAGSIFRTRYWLFFRGTRERMHCSFASSAKEHAKECILSRHPRKNAERAKIIAGPCDDGDIDVRHLR